VPFSVGRSLFLRAASTFMSATTLLAKLISKIIWVIVRKVVRVTRRLANSGLRSVNGEEVE
jgi:hypothetical protein